MNEPVRYRDEISRGIIMLKNKLNRYLKKVFLIKLMMHVELIMSKTIFRVANRPPIKLVK